MIIHHSNYRKIEFQKYKRIFIFGCSFTNYQAWPTWANIISLDCADSSPQIFNIAQTGGGNLFISSTVISSSLYYNFCKDDLVLLMWSTHCREDRYKDTRWVCPGNVWTQNIINEDFIKEWACPKGYIVRDLALMTTTRNYLEHLPCDAILLKSVEPSYDRRLFTGSGFEEVLTLYKKEIDNFAAPLYNFVHNGLGGWINGHEYYWPGVGGSTEKKKFQDYHPNPDMYLNYLQGIGFSFKDITVEKVKELNSNILQIDNYNDLCRFRNIWMQKHLQKNIDNPHII